MLNIYRGINRNDRGTNNANPRLAEFVVVLLALRTSQATLLIASRASCIDPVVQRSAAKSNHETSC